MTKKETRERKARKALEQRVSDIVSGACGRHVDRLDTPTPGELADLVPAMRDIFAPICENGSVSDLEWMFEANQLHHFSDVEDITDWLYEQGVRA
jgi:hypothetical protein